MRLARYDERLLASAFASATASRFVRACALMRNTGVFGIGAARILRRTASCDIPVFFATRLITGCASAARLYASVRALDATAKFASAPGTLASTDVIPSRV